jgi:hypothetical protein
VQEVPIRRRTIQIRKKAFRDLWDDETQREVVIESLKADCEVRRGRPPGL